MTGPISQPAAQPAASSPDALLRHPALRPRLWRRILQLARIQRMHVPAVMRRGGRSQSRAPATDVHPLQRSLECAETPSVEPSHGHGQGRPDGSQVCCCSQVPSSLLSMLFG